jgi:hypothetical protein
MAEVEGEQFIGLGLGIQEHVAPGDPDVDCARSDVDRDIARAQIEELDVVVRVQDHEFGTGAPLAITGLPEHERGGFGEHALVGHRNAQHPTSSSRVIVRKPEVEQ